MKKVLSLILAVLLLLAMLVSCTNTVVTEDENINETDKDIDSIEVPARSYSIVTDKLTETITDDDGNVLIETVAYYPVVDNPINLPFVDRINEDFKRYAQNFIDEARAKKEDALILREEMGADKFIPFAYELTFEETYNTSDIISITNNKYVNIGGAHPSTIMESKSFSVGLEEELSLSRVINTTKLEGSLSDYVINLFVDEIKEIAPDFAEQYTYDYVREYVGYVQFYLTPNFVVLYFNQGEIAPYALGVIRVEIPYDSDLFYIQDDGKLILN